MLRQLMATSNSSDNVTSESGHAEMPRRKNYTKYYHRGLVVCPRMFHFLHTIGEIRLKNLVKSLKLNGLTARIHGNTKRRHINTLSLSSVEFVVRFLINHTDLNGLLLPGRVPGYSRSDIKLLPSSVSKRVIWRVYDEGSLAIQKNTC